MSLILLVQILLAAPSYAFAKHTCRISGKSDLFLFSQGTCCQAPQPESQGAAFEFGGCCEVVHFQHGGIPFALSEGHYCSDFPSFQVGPLMSPQHSWSPVATQALPWNAHAPPSPHVAQLQTLSLIQVFRL